eukprot:CAMPEP_0169481202 /NCGR_PEP_ID=MMETSP1042-20121227/29981_1 /TAXON_ID=464988 /ORGANISM="Hemiselmis andersenii, Strain CCMP1180" /LENGTH=83 /DNA_ID=CAMNT_0009595917 /DNA_START=28 /DNA_END=279 /DNA_ORIENTATION=+
MLSTSEATPKPSSAVTGAPPARGGTSSRKRKPSMLWRERADARRENLVGASMRETGESDGSRPSSSDCERSPSVQRSSTRAGV